MDAVSIDKMSPGIDYQCIEHIQKRLEKVKGF
jgi:hypothetical protein